MSVQQKRSTRIEIVPCRVNPTEGIVARTDQSIWLPHAKFWKGLRRARSTEPHYLRLRASNGRILATSETYASLANAQRAAGAWRTAFADVMTQRHPVAVVES